MSAIESRKSIKSASYNPMIVRLKKFISNSLTSPEIDLFVGVRGLVWMFPFGFVCKAVRCIFVVKVLHALDLAKNACLRSL